MSTTRPGTAHRCRRGCLVCALAILSGSGSALAGQHIPSPTPRASSAAGTPTATPTPTLSCDHPTAVPRAAPEVVRSGELVTLDGRASGGAISAVRWAQSAGPRVTIANADSPVASFIAPPVAGPTMATIALTLFSPCTPPVLTAYVDVTILPLPGVASIAVEEATVVVGEPATIGVRLHADRPVASVAHTLRLGSAIAFVAGDDGHPQCAVPDELGATAAQFEFTPPGCVADGCTGIDVAIGSREAIPDGALLYRCSVVDAGPSPTTCAYPYDCCAHLLGCEDPSAAGTEGASVPAQCVEGAVRIQYSQPTAEFVFSADPSAPQVGDLVRISVDTVRGRPGLIGMPVYSLGGTQPFLAGDVAPRHFTGPRRVTYELQAVQAGTVELSIGMGFETRQGCPGNDFYGFDSLASDIFPLTITAAACAGDCNADGRVGIDELITGVRMALGDAGPIACPAMDGDRSGTIEVDDLVAAVAASLRGCAALAPLQRPEL